MANKRISEAIDIVTLAATDAVPVERLGNGTAYKTTIAEIEAKVLDGTLDIPASSGAADWHVMISEATFEGHKDQVMFIGYNNPAVGAVDSASLPKMFLGLETDYYTNPVNHVSEYYLEWDSAGGAVGLRPMHITIDYITNTAQINLSGRVVLASDAFVEHSSISSTGEMIIGGNITFGANKGPILTDRSDGHTYRLKVTAGVLGVEQVT
jgi:hypothetical protein